ncbi:hypothetical protein [Deinococcus sp. 12RED42]|uniref:hypothetical protein n=1 Tax=Deinococcus sp. 12RED42 TaxID=2745872 RepID=UPI001E338B56|nr:hypothetical protein [Deinococcus sp. 12RED42]MCD0165708.1 hypothetical protein [Deinococcus sp. 12RED42]
MKRSTQLIALMAALAAGSASGQTSVSPDTNKGTNAGTVITNTAVATYQDPANVNQNLSSTSNTVSTTVLPKSAFDITYPSGADADTTDTPAGAPASHQRTNVVPGSRLVFPYVAVNNGNDTQTITLTSDPTPGVSGIQYFLSNPDTNNDGLVSDTELAAATPVTSIVLPVAGDDPNTAAIENNTGIVQFYQVYVATGAPGAVVGATPIGSGQAWNGTANVPTTEQANPGGSAHDDLWWQYNASTIVSPSLTNNPGTPVTGGVDSPPAGGANVPGYTDPSGTVVAVIGDEQFAYPKADPNAANDTVVFTNIVTNASSVPDTVTLSVVPRTNQTGYTQTVTPTGNPGEYTVVQTNPDGTTTTATVTLSAVNATAPANGNVTYTVTVTYPDQDSLPNPSPIYLQIGVDSGNDTNTTPDDFTYDTILPPAMQFGDTTVGLGATDVVASQTGTAGSTVTFPMDVANTGEYADTYRLSGYTVVTLLDGSRQIVPINYTGTGLTSTGTVAVAVDLNGDGDTTDPGETASVPVYTTGSVAPNTELDVNATVALPANVRATGATPYVLTQRATSEYSNIALTDLNDTITVNLSGTLAVGKFTQRSSTAAGTEYVLGNPGSAVAGVSSDPAAIANPLNYSALNSTNYVPGTQYSYKIIAKNTYNTRVEKFFLQDTLNSNLEFNSVAGVISGNSLVEINDTSSSTIIYSTDGVTWTSSAPVTPGSTVYVAVDDAVQPGLQPGGLDPNATLEMTITVTIK